MSYMGMARWEGGTWYMNPFEITCEQVKLLLSANVLNDDEFSITFYTHYAWGHVTETYFYNSSYHEIEIHYMCPTSYNRTKKLEWLRKRGYPY